jgi:hypothetical protein
MRRAVAAAADVPAAGEDALVGGGDARGRVGDGLAAGWDVGAAVADARGGGGDARGGGG